MVSMKDISAVCGVSVATVSKALNNQNDIGQETKRRIRQTAEEMGYFPNTAAKMLKTNRSYNIGVLFSHEDYSGLTHDYYAFVLDSLKNTVEEKGYDITFVNTSIRRKGETSYLEHCKSRGFDGVAIVCTDFYSPEILQLVRGGIPIVTLDHLFNNVCAVMSNNVQGMQDLLTYIYEKGHRRVSYIHGADSAVTQSRLSSFYRTAAQLGLTIPDEYIRMSPYRDTKGAYAETVRLLELREPPTCIIYPDDFSAFGGYNAIQERGMRIPDDISIAGYDGIRIARHIEPTLTTLRQDTEELGRQVGEKLLSLIEHPKTTLVETIVVEGHVFEGNSVANIRGKIMSAPILFDQSRLKAYDGLMRLCEFAGKSGEWQQTLWSELLMNQNLYDAFVYYLENHGLPDEPKCGAYSLTDCYVWQTRQDNLRMDTGKNTESCNKEDMVLRSFMMMADMQRHPEDYAKKLGDWKGMDQTM